MPRPAAASPKINDDTKNFSGDPTSDGNAPVKSLNSFRFGPISTLVSWFNKTESKA